MAKVTLESRQWKQTIEKDVSMAFPTLEESILFYLFYFIFIF